MKLVLQHCGNLLFYGRFDESIYGNACLLCKHGDLTMYFGRYTYIQGTRIALTRFYPFRFAMGKVIIYRAMKILPKFCNSLPLIGNHCIMR